MAEPIEHDALLNPAAVVGAGYWPLPWYLRGLDSVGYWPEPQETFSRYPIVFAMPEQVARTDQLLHTSHIRLPRGLRDNVSLMIYLRRDIWEQWKEAPIL